MVSVTWSSVSEVALVAERVRVLPAAAAVLDVGRGRDGVAFGLVEVARAADDGDGAVGSEDVVGALDQEGTAVVLGGDAHVERPVEPDLPVHDLVERRHLPVLHTELGGVGVGRGRQRHPAHDRQNAQRPVHNVPEVGVRVRPPQLLPIQHERLRVLMVPALPHLPCTPHGNRVRRQQRREKHNECQPRPAPGCHGVQGLARVQDLRASVTRGRLTHL